MRPPLLQIALAAILFTLLGCSERSSDPSLRDAGMDASDRDDTSGSSDVVEMDAIDAVGDLDVRSDGDDDAPMDTDTSEEELDTSRADDPEEDLATDAGSAVPDFADEDFCSEVEGFGPVFPAIVSNWVDQDEASTLPEDPLVIVGSSSVRRWEGFASAYRDYRPLQRGFGGAQLGEVAFFAEELVVRHDPRAVIVFAGTNDVAADVAADVVVERFRCLRQRIGRRLGWSRPVFFIGITPTPSRWATWETANAVNEGVRALEAVDPALRYVDVPAAFLRTGSPPDLSLFVSDQLHLSAAGYALWDSVLRPAVEARLPPLEPSSSPSPTLRPGERLLVDFGPGDQINGEPTPSPDYLGQHWNNWHALDGGAAVLPGEHLDDLQNASGGATATDLVITGGFVANGWANGGLRWPETGLLGELAVGSATGDFFYLGGDDLTGGFFLSGLDPDRRYTLSLFASRQDGERRVTRFEVEGAETTSALLQTSGEGAGSAELPWNDNEALVFSSVQPDAWGHIFVDLSVEEGTYGYISLLELRAE